MGGSVTWLTHQFSVYTHGANWTDTPGVYIFAGLNQQNQWVPLYIGQTDSFRNRIPLHEKWTQAQQAGATHVHAMGVQQAATRDVVEKQLIQAYQPRLNDQLR